MNYREAGIRDIPGMQEIRNAVKENKLSDPSVIKDDDYKIYFGENGNSWVCEIDNSIVGFSIIDVTNSNIWALFVHPDLESKGIGLSLHDIMVNWYFDRYENDLWLSTSPGTRAESFYKKAGWIETGVYKKETKFELSKKDWQSSHL